MPLDSKDVTVQALLEWDVGERLPVASPMTKQASVSSTDRGAASLRMRVWRYRNNELKKLLVWKPASICHIECRVTR